MGAREPDEQLRVLCVLGKSPLPDDTGNRRRLLRLVEAAAEVHDVRVLVVDRSIRAEDRAAADRASFPVDALVEVANRRWSARSVARWLVLATVTQRWMDADLAEAEATIRREVAEHRPHVIWVDNAILSTILPPTGTPVVVDLSHSERESIGSQLRGRLRSWPAFRTSWRSTIVLALDRRARIRAESTALERAASVTTCFPLDEQDPPLVPTGMVRFVANGVDVAPLGDLAHTRRLLFVGNLSYEPNQLAVRQLVQEILPALRAEDPTIELDLVGIGAETIPDLRGAAGVTVHGFVEDLGAPYRTAELIVAPITSGSGTRLKILEAFARGVPLVTTPEGIAGLPVEHGRAVEVASGTAGLVAAARALLDDRERADRQRRLAYDWVVATHTWEAIGHAFRDALAEAGGSTVVTAG